MIPILFFGIFALVIGGILMASNLKSLERRKRILNTPTTSIAQAPGNAVVEVKGRILPSEQGVLIAPFSGRQVVFARLIIQEYRSSGRSGTWHTVFTQAQARDFMIDDGSGQYARVLANGAEVILDRQKIASSGTFNDAPPHLEQFLRAHGLSSTSWLGFNKQMRYEEELLSPGDPIYALGPSRRDAGPPVSDGYRMVPSSQLVLFAAGTGRGELIVSNKTEQELTNRLLGGFMWGAGCASVGALSLLLGLAAAAFAFMR